MCCLSYDKNSIFFFFRLLQISSSIAIIPNRLNAILFNKTFCHFTTDVFKRTFIILHNKWQWLNWLIYWKWQRESEKETKSVTSRMRGRGGYENVRRKYLCLSKISIISSRFQEFHDHLQLFKCENLDTHRNKHV
jgi:hypothetical protein